MKPKKSEITVETGKLWLVLDVNYLCYRAFHSTGQLSFNEEPTGVTFGVLREIKYLETRFGSSNMVFCFDHGKGLREKKYSWYKEGRRNKKYTEEEEVQRAGLQSQIRKLKINYLSDLGYRNIMFQDGYEADDMIASVVAGIPIPNRIVIVSADHDLYQLLSYRTSMYNPSSKATLTEEGFKKEFGVETTQWPMVKAIAGCKSDGIPGIPGVAEKTACQYLSGNLKKTSVKYGKIEAGRDVRLRNMPLVSLPYPGAKPFKPQRDEIDPTAWANLIDELGFSSFETSGVLSNTIQHRRK